MTITLIRPTQEGVRRLFTFYAICALGAVANVGIAGDVFSKNEVWWLAGLCRHRRRIGLELCRLFRFHLEAKITSQMKLFLTAAIPDLRGQSGLTIRRGPCETWSSKLIARGIETKYRIGIS